MDLVQLSLTKINSIINKFKSWTRRFEKYSSCMRIHHIALVEYFKTVKSSRDDSDPQISFGKQRLGIQNKSSAKRNTNYERTQN